MKINVLSLFGGIECGRVAMDRLGWDIRNYFSSEVDEYAIEISKKNWPDMIHLGDVKDISYFPKARVLQVQDRSTSIDLQVLIGGSPCQDLSGANLKGKGLKGNKSSLFYEYARLLQEIRPAYFLFENVASMKKEDRDEITATLWVDPQLIDSNFFSAQNRRRLYWVGRWNGYRYEQVNIPLPREVSSVKIKDILQDIPLDSPLWKPIPEKYLTGDGRVKLKEATKKGFVLAWPGDVVDINQPNSDTHRGRLMTDKLHTLTANMYKGNIPYVIAVARDRKDERLRVPDDQEKLPTLRAVMGTCGNNVPFLVNTDTLVWRPLTPLECERGQTLPDNYTEGVSKSRRLKAIGNGWTVDTIAYILSFFTF